MSRFKSTIDYILKIKELIFVVAAITISVLNVWYTYKSASIVKGLETVSVQANSNADGIEKNSKRIDILEETSTDTNEKITKVVCYLLKEDCLK